MEDEVARWMEIERWMEREEMLAVDDDVGMVDEE